MGLFNLGFFTLHSGEKTPFKIDCDALSEEDLEAAAYMLKNLLPVYSSVIGVPCGGLRLAEKMRKYQRAVGGPLLIADDVFTTGKSLEEVRDRFRMAFNLDEEQVIGAVIFARRRVTLPWVRALFTMEEKGLEFDSSWEEERD